MSKGLKVAVIPDCQVRQGVPVDHLTWVGSYIADKKPDVIVCLGDFADMPSLSSYDKGKKSYEGRRYSKDLAAVRHGMALLMEPIRKVRNYHPRLVLTLGNHEDRITRAVEEDAKLEGTISLKDLRYEGYGWKVYPYLTPVKIGGVTFCHFMPSGPLGRPCSSARAIITKHHMSCVVGHQQGKDIAYGRRGDGSAITTIIAGSCYQHKESYMNPLENVHWRGILFLHEVHNGQFDEMSVSLNYLKQRYRRHV